MIPDGEKVTRAYLAANDDVEALGTRVVGRTPDSTAASWVRLMQLDAQKRSRREHLIEYLFQIDCYASKVGLNGSPQGEASLIARTVRAALEVMPDAEHDGAVCTSTRVVGDTRRPDTDFEPARERVILTVSVHLHA